MDNQQILTQFHQIRTAERALQIVKTDFDVVFITNKEVTQSYWQLRIDEEPHDRDGCTR